MPLHGIHHITAITGDARRNVDFYAERLAVEGVAAERQAGALRFADPEGLQLELSITDAREQPHRAAADDIPTEHALLGFAGVHAFAGAPERSGTLLAALGFEARSEDGRAFVVGVEGGERTAGYVYDSPPPERPAQGAGTVHHVAWAARDDEEEMDLRERAVGAGARATPQIDRQYFRSVYFREPSGVLFELATVEPGFAVDEDPERLGEELRLPPQHEHLREHLEQVLTPLENPRSSAARG